jgi:uncharacterized protein
MNKCTECKALCCRYVALEIDEPTCKKDWDHIFWYLHHQNIRIFIDHDGDWMIEFQTPCKNLSEDQQCTIYHNRPKVCRSHSSGECEFSGEESSYQHMFNNAEELKQYLEEQNITYQFNEFKK